MTSDMHALQATLQSFGVADSVAERLRARDARSRARREGLSVVVLSCRRPDVFTRLADQLPPCGDVLLETIVVWNGGDRETREAAERRGWTVLRGSNRSFAAGCNDAVAASHSSHVLLLSDDAEVTPAALDLLWARRGYPLVAPTIVDRRGQVNCAGGVFDGGLMPIHRGHGLTLDALDRRDRFCPWSTGAALLISRQLWDALGGFDEDYVAFGGYQDVDLCLRAGERGVHVLVTADAPITHEDHGTRDGRDDAPNRRRYERLWLETDRLRHMLGLVC